MTSQALLDFLKNNPFVLAPMAAITDSPTRRLYRMHGAPIVVTELISATGLQYNSAKTRQLLAFKSEEKIVGAQFFGHEVDHLVQAGRIAQDMGYDFVDLNCGCPVPKVVNKGAGSALLKEPLKLASILERLVKNVSIPVTIKIRTGWDEKSKNADLISKLAFESGVTWVAIHGRTRAQGYQGAVDWDYIGQVCQRVTGPIIGNGDVVTPEMAVQRLKSSGCAAVMIGRGALKDPFIFKKAMSLWKGQQVMPTTLEDYRQFLADMWSIYESEYAPRIFQIQVKKMLVWMATGYPYASELRRRLYEQDYEPQALWDLALAFFEKALQWGRHNRDNEGFLMGGHG